MHEIVAVLFRIINFAIIIGASWYLFKRYALSWITTQISQREDQLAALHATAHALAQQQQEIEQAIIDQTRTYHALNQKIEQWHAAFALESYERQQEKQRIEHLLKDQVKIQQAYLQLQQAQKEMIPRALKSAHDTLSNTYVDSKKSETFIAHLIDDMKKSIS